MTAGDRLIILILNIRQFYEYFLTPTIKGKHSKQQTFRNKDTSYK